MFLTKLINNNKFLFVAFVTLFFLTRIPGISFDIINPDAVNWHYRSEQFVVGLKNFDFARTYQHYQPGVTLMWLMGPTVEIVKRIYDVLGYNKDTFLIFDYYSKISVILAQFILSLIGIFALSKIIGFKKSILAFFVFSFEPFFIANSRLLHLDVLLSLFMLNGMLFSYLYIKEGKLKWVLFSGVFLGLSVLTKSVGIGAFLFSLGFGALYIYKKDGLKRSLLYALYLVIPFLVTFILLFPAMWVDYKTVLLGLYDGIERVGIRKGHNQIVFGSSTRDGGWIFYPLVFLIKSSPLLLLSIILFIKNFRNIKKEDMGLLGYLGIFFFGYLLVMSFSSKKIDRYFVPVYVYLGLLSAYTLDVYVRAFSVAIKRYLLILLMFFSILYPLFSFYPYYFIYTNPLFGSPEFVHRNLLAQKPFGVGIVKLKEIIFERYSKDGEYPTLAFYDKKPMGAIYRGSKIFDIELDGTKRYDLLILGVNEPFPEKVTESKAQFELDYVVNINGLDYWYIYVKKN